jgi:hypothetical protein
MTLPMKTAGIGSTVGLIVMYVILNAARSDSLSSGTLFLLIPTAIFGFGYNGQGGLAGVMVWTLEVGGQTVLYGLLGWFVGIALQKLKGKH